jgi:hypothetical protein
LISARAKANGLAAMAAAGAVLLYRFPPKEHSFYPRCPFYLLTHYRCPGCGTTRALSELLHGHFAAALHFNPAVTLLAPVVLGYFAVAYWTAVGENRFAWPEPPRWTWKAAVASVLLFGLARGLFEPAL